MRQFEFPELVFRLAAAPSRFAAIPLPPPSNMRLQFSFIFIFRLTAKWQIGLLHVVAIDGALLRIARLRLNSSV